MSKLETVFNRLSKAHAMLTDRVEIARLAQELRDNQQVLILDSQNEHSELPNKPGIYYFEAKFKFSTTEELASFGERWGLIRALTNTDNIPRYYSTRSENHVKLLAAGKPIPFYLGKHRKIASRIAEHIESPLRSNTYALKLKARPHLLADMELKYSYRVFDIPLTTYYGMALIEASLRKILNPILGKQ